MALWWKSTHSTHRWSKGFPPSLRPTPPQWGVPVHSASPSEEPKVWHVCAWRELAPQTGARRADGSNLHPAAAWPKLRHRSNGFRLQITMRASKRLDRVYCNVMATDERKRNYKNIGWSLRQNNSQTKNSVVCGFTWFWACFLEVGHVALYSMSVMTSIHCDPVQTSDTVCIHSIHLLKFIFIIRLFPLLHVWSCPNLMPHLNYLKKNTKIKNWSQQDIIHLPNSKPNWSQNLSAILTKL